MGRSRRRGTLALVFDRAVRSTDRHSRSHSSVNRDPLRPDRPVETSSRYLETEGRSPPFSSALLRAPPCPRRADHPGATRLRPAAQLIGKLPSAPDGPEIVAPPLPPRSFAQDCSHTFHITPLGHGLIGTSKSLFCLGGAITTFHEILFLWNVVESPRGSIPQWTMERV